MPIEFPLKPDGDSFALLSELTETSDDFSSKLATHMSTDAFKWQDNYDTDFDLYKTAAKAAGLQIDPDPLNSVTVNNTFTVPSANTGVSGQYGGILIISIVNLNGDFIVVNLGNRTYTTEGSPEGIAYTKYMRLNSGDTVTVTGGLGVVVFIPWIPDQNSQIAQTVAMLTSSISSVYASAIEAAKEIYTGTGNLNYDMTQPTKVIGTGGLITLGGSEGFTVPQNGCLIVTYSALVGAAKSILVDGDVVWSAVLSLLGASTTKSPSDPIRVNSGQIVTATGLLGVGEALDVTFYPNA